MSGHANRKQYFVIFVILTALTAFEVGITYLGLPRSMLIAGLIGLALSKAALVALFYMHLGSETKSLKLVVGVPMAFPALYAVVLIIESIARSAFT